MARPERPLDPEAGPISRFAADLRQLRHSAGSPKYLQMARATGRSRTALAEAAGGDHLPTWETVEAFVTACKADVRVWRTRWEQAQEAIRGVPDPTAAPPLSDARDAREPETSSDPVVVAEEGSSTSRQRWAALAVAVVVLAAGLGAAWWWHERGQGGPSTSAVVVTVQNKVAVGATSLTEDATPEFLSSKPVAYCHRRGCMVAGTDTLWSGALLPAVCYTHGETITNANLSSPGIRDNPGAASSDGWYQVQLPSGVTGYIPDAYLAPQDRGGKGLPPCR